MDDSTAAEHFQAAVNDSGSEKRTARMVWAALLGGGGGGGGGGPGTTWNYVFDSTGGGVQDPSKNVFTVWADLAAAILALPEGIQPRINFLGSFTVPLAGMPATGWYMALGTWTSPILATGTIIVDIPDGVLIDSLSRLELGIAVRVAPTTGAGTFNWNTFSTFAPGAPWVFSVGLGAVLNNIGTAAVIFGPATGQFIVFAAATAAFGTIGPDTAPFVDADAPDTVIAAQSFSGFYGSLPAGWLAGSAFLVDQIGVDTRSVDNPLWTGSVVFTAQSILNPRAMSGARKTLVFTNDPISMNETDTFDDWTKLFALYSNAEYVGPIDISLKQILGGPSLVVPAGTWQLKQGTRIVSANNVAQNAMLELAPGAELVDLNYVGIGVVIVGAGGQLTFTPPPVGSSSAVVLLLQGIGGSLACSSPTPLIDWGYDQADGLLIIGLADAASITGQGGFPVVNVTPLGAFPSGVAVYGLGGSLDPSAITGSNGAGTALFGFLATSSATLSFDQPGWAGAPLGTLYQSVSRPRLIVQTPTLTAVGPYVMGDAAGPIFPGASGELGCEFVRVDPTANAVDVQLPKADGCVGQTCVIKEVSGAPLFTTTVTSAGGLVEGGASDVLAGAYFVGRYTSDGTDWWMT